METEESLDESSREIEATDTSKAPTGFAGGLPKKKALLEKEGVPFKGERVRLDEKFEF